MNHKQVHGIDEENPSHLESRRSHRSRNVTVNFNLWPRYSNWIKTVAGRIIGSNI